MSESAMTPAHRFTVGGALGFGFEVLRARPVAVLTLLGLQTLIYLALTMVQYGVMGPIAREGLLLAEAGNMGGAFALNMRLSGFSSLFSLISAPLWLWIEAVWLVLLMSGRFTLWPGWGSLGRLTLSYVIIFGVFFAFFVVLTFMIATGLVVFALVQESGGDPVMAGVVSAALGLILLVLVLVGFALLSGLPAHSVTGRLDIGQAVSTAWRHLGRVCVAWLVFMLVYTLIMAVTYGAYAINFMDEFRAMMETISAQTQDPFLMLRVYAETMPSGRDLLMLVLNTAPAMLISSAIMMIGRGISSKLALSMPEPEKKAD
jgi:hypothetical protein